MKHLKLFEHHSLNDAFEEVAKQSVEYFLSDSEIDIDVKFFEDMPITEKDMDNRADDFKKVLRKYNLDLESYDTESVAIVKLPLWKQSDILKKLNDKTGLFN